MEWQGLLERKEIIYKSLQNWGMNHSEQTKSLYLDIDAKPRLGDIIQARQIIEKNTAYNIEFIEVLSEKALEYEKGNRRFEVTEF